LKRLEEKRLEEKRKRGKEEERMAGTGREREKVNLLFSVIPLASLPLASLPLV